MGKQAAKKKVKKDASKKTSAKKTSTVNKTKKDAAKKPTPRKANTKKKAVEVKTKTKKEILQDKCNEYLKKIKNYYNNNKKLCNRIILVSIIMIVLIIIYSGSTRNYTSDINKNYDTNQMINGLKIKYENGQEIELTKFKHKFTAEKTITIKNTTDNYVKYNLEWKDVTNTLKEQSALIYELKGKGNNVGNVSQSQAPVTSSKLLSNLIVSPRKKHTYKLIFTYKPGSINEDAIFKGYLNIYIE